MAHEGVHDGPMTEEEDIDGLAAEYVLGSLDGAERRDVDARRARDRVLDAAIAAWEGRLAALGDFDPGEQPPAHLYAGIARRIWGSATLDAPRPPTWQQARWRRAAVAAGALAAVLAIAALLPPQRQPAGTAAGPLLAVLQRSPASQTADEHADAAQASPAFLVAIDPKLRSILVTPIAARPVARRSYELWLMAQPTPVPLGIIAPAAATTLPWPAAADRQDVAPDAFLGASLAVSLEPEGGSTTGAPSGPILYSGKPSPPK